MKILIITQKIDPRDSVLGFFYRWVEEFSNQFSKVEVICLEKGEYGPPQNVSIHSLGKEAGRSRLKYIYRFYKYIWQLRNKYDSVFVHMNQEYVLLGWLPWLLLGKPIFLWRNHKQGNFLTRLAVLLSRGVYCTSPESFTAKFKKTKLMPIGANIPDATNTEARIPRSVLFFGRISPVKNVHLFIKAIEILYKREVTFEAKIVGDPVNKEDFDYKAKLEAESAPLVKAGVLKWQDGVAATETKKYYQSHDVFVNLTGAGSMDKTIFSAMSYSALVLVSNPYFKGVIPEVCQTSLDPEDVAKRIEILLDLDRETRMLYTEEFYKYVADNHSLKKLVEIVRGDMS